MTNKEYALIAAELKYVKAFVEKFANEEYTKGKYDAWYVVVITLSGALAKENPRFRTETFLKGCGLIP
jgi:hypothetical protein